MGSPPSRYSTFVTIPLPTDEQLGAKTVAKLKPANDLNVARISQEPPTCSMALPV
jgi:hypothetical protein